ncbi:MAG: preprotein translocase subunit SecA [bacterium]
MSLITKLLGDPNAKKVSGLQKYVDSANKLETEIEKYSDSDIIKRIAEIKLAVTKKIDSEAGKEKDKDSLKTIINDALEPYIGEVFALTREASKRVLGMRDFDVQLIGALVLNEGNISEMMTGEGKTLVATLSAVLNALTSRGVHIVTVNDYLARRDAGWMGKLYFAMGMSVGVIVHDSAFIYDPNYEDERVVDEATENLRPVTRKEAYLTDITYGTNNEFGFDYLRDNMVQNIEQMVQRPLNYAIVDEVDSILIDEARTPLIISAPAEESTDKYVQIDLLVKNLKAETDYTIDEKQKAASLTDAGIQHMEKLLGVENIYEEYGIENVHHIEQALKANVLFRVDKDYVVKDGEIIIVDEFTGRLMFGRRYSEGLHQAIEAKEGVEVNRESLTMATISFQNYFRLYTKLSGMTGTAATEAEEFSKIYKLAVIKIPTNQKNIRKDEPDLIYKNELGKFNAIVEDIKIRTKAGQPVLVGTVSIEKNELLADLLKRNGVKHEVLNAKNHEKEAMIIKKAGQRSAVTVATNMAGRGTDIVLGDGIADVGGLHVIGTERHESRRIDNQLRGRCGRQGDPGSTQFFVSLDDDLMRIFGSDRVGSVMEKLGLPEDQSIQHNMITKSLESAQRKVEGHNFDIRKHLVEYDDVMNKQRAYIYRLRQQVLSEENLKQNYLDIISNFTKSVIAKNINTVTGEVMGAEITTEISGIIGSEVKVDNKVLLGSQADLEKAINSVFIEAYDDKEKRIGADMMRILEKALYLRTIDMLWVDHLDAIDHLRDGIGLRGYGQKDPLIEYKNESYRMFKMLLAAIDSEILNLVYKVEITHNAPTTETQVTRAVATENTKGPIAERTVVKKIAKKNIGRNDPCPCGSGKKYKKCHGK